MRYLHTSSESGRRGSCQSPFAALAALACAALVVGCLPDGTSSGAVATLKTPAEGDLLAIGTQQPIEWDLSPEVSAVDIKAHLPDGSAKVIAERTPNDGTFSWNVPLLPGADPGTYSIAVEPSGEATSVEFTPGVIGDLAVGSIAGFKWNGTTEDYYWVDLITGESKVLGTVGDMLLWQGDSAFDAGNGLIYVVASPNEALTVWKVYSLDAATGALVRDVEITGANPSSIRVNSQGMILGMSWNGAKEDISTLDPKTGNVTTIGTVGNLSLWSGETAIDNVNNRLYVIGMEDPDFNPITLENGPNAKWSVYTLDASSGALLDTKPLAEPASIRGISGLATNSKGELIGFWWNGSAEELIVIDPQTGGITVRGTVGDLEMWSGYTALNPTTDVIHVFGQNPAMTTKLYTVDTTSGALLYDLPVTDNPSTALLVF